MTPRARVPASEYDAIEAVNWSTLKHLATSARLLRYRVEHPREDTKSLRLGRAIHCAVLEPERWRSGYLRHPDFGDLRTKAAQAARAEWLARNADARAGKLVPQPDFGDLRKKENKARKEAFLEKVPDGARVVTGSEDLDGFFGAGVEVLSAEEHELAGRCAASVREHPRASDLLSTGRPEEVVTWTDERTGLACKGRLDWVRPRFFLDLKSTRRATLGQMWVDFGRLLYHGQLAWYHDAAIAARVLPPDAHQPRVILVQTVEPYDTIAAVLDGDELERGRELYRSLLDRYALCQSTGWYPGLAPDFVSVRLPSWAMVGLEDRGEEDW